MLLLTSCLKGIWHLCSNKCDILDAKVLSELLLGMIKNQVTFFYVAASGLLHLQLKNSEKLI